MGSPDHHRLLIHHPGDDQLAHIPHPLRRLLSGISWVNPLDYHRLYDWHLPVGAVLPAKGPSRRYINEALQRAPPPTSHRTKNGRFENLPYTATIKQAQWLTVHSIRSLIGINQKNYIRQDQS
jgi:hypothetical protein